MAYHPDQIILAIESLCPTLKNFADYGVSNLNDGNGNFIAFWNSTTVPQPTMAQIEAVDTDALLAKASVPQTVSPRQARLALLAAGLLDQVEASVSAAGGATKITWDYATEINRTDPLIISIGAALKLTDDQIDVLFRYAASV
jgi:hypothetical protein